LSKDDSKGSPKLGNNKDNIEKFANPSIEKQFK
jgi:hypothetical protein